MSLQPGGSSKGAPPIVRGTATWSAIAGVALVVVALLSWRSSWVLSHATHAAVILDSLVIIPCAIAALSVIIKPPTQSVGNRRAFLGIPDRLGLVALLLSAGIGVGLAGLANARRSGFDALDAGTGCFEISNGQGGDRFCVSFEEWQRVGRFQDLERPALLTFMAMVFAVALVVMVKRAGDERRSPTA